MEHSKSIEQWLRLIRSDGVGSVGFFRLLKRFGSVDKVLGLSVAQLTSVEGIGPKTAEKIAISRDSFNVDAEMSLADKLGVSIINADDSRYPVLLKNVYDKPAVLYVKGDLRREDNLAIAMVGARRSSIYGSEQASRFSHLLASAGFTIISGMARGIDTAAHQAALTAGGRTIAVLGSGLANIYPPENKELFKKIAESGACISELPLTYEPRSEHFPARNRIIAGMSLGTIVVEAAYNSGALITAKAALEYDREVMALPGRVDSPLSRGPNRLIKNGAKLIESIEDVTEALGYIGDQLTSHAAEAAKRAADKYEPTLFSSEMFNLSAAEKLLFESLTKEQTHIEELIEQTGIETGQVNSSLVSLQLKGLIKQLPGNYFIRR